MGNMRRQQGILGGKSAWGAAVVLLVLLGLSLVAAVTFGTIALPVGDVYRVIGYALLGVGDPAVWGPGTAIHDVVLLIRLPRLVLAVAVGAGLSVCGAVMQAVVKNPLADPYVLGISSGASLGASAAILLGVGAALGSGYVGIVGALGAFAVSLAVVAIANIGGRANAVKLLLAGTALSSVCGALSNFIIYFADNDHALTQVVHWSMGSMAAADWESNCIIGAVVLLGVLFFWSQARNLNLMLLGDETAITLGTDMHRWRLLYLLVSSAMIGFVVYKAGMIGFVGLVIPHVVRMIFGTDHRKLIPLSALLGALFLLWADVLCRVVLPGNELPIGILTAMVGAPVFIYLMIRKQYGFGGREG